jgi:hypothetical protein
LTYLPHSIAEDDFQQITLHWQELQSLCP